MIGISHQGERWQEVSDGGGGEEDDPGPDGGDSRLANAGSASRGATSFGGRGGAGARARPGGRGALQPR